MLESLVVWVNLNPWAEPAALFAIALVTLLIYMSRNAEEMGMGGVE